MLNFLREYIKKHREVKSYVLKTGAIVGCPKETEFFNNGIVPIPKEKSLIINKIALEKAIRKESIVSDKERGIYLETERGLRHYYINYKGSKVKKIIKVVNDVNNLRDKEYVLRHLMEVLDNSCDTLLIEFHSYFNMASKTILIAVKENIIKIIRLGSNEITELEIDKIIDMEETEKLNEKIRGKLIGAIEYEELALKTLLKKCEKCMFEKNCTLEGKSQ